MQQTIVVAGGAGFVGATFAHYAHKKGYRVIIIDTRDRMRRLQHMHIFPDPGLTFLSLNLAEDRISLAEPVDALVHFAALPQVDYSLYYPDLVLNNNIRALCTSLEFVRRQAIPLLFISSVEVYGGNEGDLLYETDLHNSLSPYATSKVSGEALLQAYRRSPGLTGSIARLTNLYGPWQTPDRIVPRLITQILSGCRCEVDGGRLRDFLYVEDAVEALLGIVEHSLWGETFNVSSGQGCDNYTLVSLLQEVSERSIDVSYVDVRQTDGRGKALVPSSRKLQDALGWRPSTSLREGIKLTYDWYVSHAEWWRQFDRNIRSDRTEPHFLTDYTHPL